jgi:hypothetical protein
VLSSTLRTIPACLIRPGEWLIPTAKSGYIPAHRARPDPDPPVPVPQWHVAQSPWLLSQRWHPLTHPNTGATGPKRACSARSSRNTGLSSRPNWPARANTYPLSFAANLIVEKGSEKGSDPFSVYRVPR